MADRKSHPSGRPKARPQEKRSRPIWRVPDDGPVTPRLQRREFAQAIGFTVGRQSSDTDEENEENHERA